MYGTSKTTYYYTYMWQLIFLRKSDCLGCAVLLCLVVCLTLLASFFLPSHLSLKHVLNDKIFTAGEKTQVVKRKVKNTDLFVARSMAEIVMW